MEILNETIIGVVSDTHVPDRVPGLHPELLPRLKAAGIHLILHAGDICVPRVLEELGAIAPVIAVRGNRDWLFINKLPLKRELEVNGVQISMLHGVGHLGNYLLDKVKYLNDGYILERYLPLLQKSAPHARVIVFGHTHYPEIIEVNGQLIFNPGSAGLGKPRDWIPSFGFLKVTVAGLVRAEIQKLG